MARASLARWLLGPAAMLAATLVVGGFLDSVAHAQPTGPQTQASPSASIYGARLMTPEEREAYQAKIRTLKTPEEQNAFRAEHQKKMQERARAQGIMLPDQPQQTQPMAPAGREPAASQQGRQIRRPGTGP